MHALDSLMPLTFEIACCLMSFLYHHDSTVSFTTLFLYIAFNVYFVFVILQLSNMSFTLSGNGI